MLRVAEAGDVPVLGFLAGHPDWPLPPAAVLGIGYIEGGQPEVRLGFRWELRAMPRPAQG